MWTGTKEQVHQAWMATVAKQDPADLPTLAEHLSTATRIQCEERAGELAAWPPSEKVFDVLLTILSEPPFASLETRPLHVAAMTGLIAHSFEGAAARIEAIRGEGRTFSNSAQMQAWFVDILQMSARAVAHAEARGVVRKSADANAAQALLKAGAHATTEVWEAARLTWQDARDPALGEALVAGEKLREEDGVGTAVRAIERHIGTPRRPVRSLRERARAQFLHGRC